MGTYMGMCNVESQKRSAKGSNFKEENRAFPLYTAPKVIDFPRYSMKCSEENEILHGIFHVVFRYTLHFMLYCGNFDYFLDSVEVITLCIIPSISL